MDMKYEDALLSPDISWDLMTQGISIPLKLYKYQSFVNEDETENPYWTGNMSGQFHMSLGCDFEDTNDCKPFFDRQFILNYMDDFFKSLGVEHQQRGQVISQIDNALTEEYFVQVMNNYQRSIRIGCFTDSHNNEKMWNKYAFQKRGYCMEYDTGKNKLFGVSTLPILYKDKPYDSSLTLACSLILECNKIGKLYSEKESIKVFGEIYKKILKMAYIPVFIKQKDVWMFEHEYRLFLLKNRTTRGGNLKMEDFLDENNNIDLSNAITSIYLGEHFDQNKKYSVLLDKVVSICQARRIKLFRKTIRDGEVIDKRII